jgi:hypothetical protein
MKNLAIAFCLAAAAGGASAAGAIYRCGADGRTYSQAPCAEGQLIESADPRSAAQRAEAVRVTAHERQVAAELERERKAQAATQKAPLASGFNARPAAPEEAASAPKKPRATKTKRLTRKDFIEVAPEAPKPVEAK